jgi:hypothetical protein
MPSIPASAIVASNPSVLSPGGLGLVLNGVMLTASTRVPVGTMQQFTNAIDVGSFFGANSSEAALAATYFAGYDDSSLKPALLYFAQYNQAAVAAYLRGGQVTTLTLAQLQALTGSLTVVMDGYTHSASSINLSAATSFSSAATIINTAINATEPTAATFTGSIAGTVLTVSAVASGTVSPGQTLSGAGVTVGTIIVAQLTGSIGATGTYTVSNTQTVASESMTGVATAIVVAFDNVTGAFTVTSGITGVPSTATFASGTLAAPIFLTQASGAVISLGSVAAVPASFMNSLTQITQRWATFMTTFDPDAGVNNVIKQAFCAWTAQQNERWNYACWDTDASPTTVVPATTSLGYILQQNGTSGVTLMYRTAGALNGVTFGDGANLAAFYCGMAASINFNQFKGRITTKFKGQSGITPDITNQTVANNLAANGYNFYGDYASATEEFRFFSNGVVSGEFLWADGYLNQIWINTSFQTQLMVLLTSVGAVPFNQAGADLIRGAMLTVIQQALDFGAFSPGVQLSSLQIAEVNSAAGLDISSTLFAQGWYLQIRTASAQVRAARGPWNISFWYTDAGAVQQLNVNSIALL